MKRLARIANLQIVALVVQMFVALRADGPVLGSPVLVLLDLVIWPLALWLSTSGPQSRRAGEIPVRFWGPWPKYWVPARLLGWVLGALNLAALVRLLFRPFPWTGEQAHVRFYAVQYAALALLFLWAAAAREDSTQPGRRGWVSLAFPHAITAAAALALFLGAEAAGLSALAAVPGSLAFAILLGTFLRRPWPPGLAVPATGTDADPAWLHAVREAAAQEERNRLARDLHDSIKQQIFTIQIGAATVRERWERDPEGARGALARVEQGARAAMAEARALLQQLRPHALSGGGLVEALREQCEALQFRTGAEVMLELGDPVPDEYLPFDTAEMLFRMAQEALANVARHARPQEVTVFLGRRGERLVLEVRDDGQGFDPAGKSAGMGLHNLRERATRLGADLHLTSRPGQGATVEVSVPLEMPEEPVEPTPAREWVLKKYLDYRRGKWVALLLTAGFSGLMMSGESSPLDRHRLLMLTGGYLVGWMVVRASSWVLLRKAEAWRPQLSRQEIESLRSSYAGMTLVWNLYLFTVFLGPRDGPVPLRAIFAFFVLFALGSIVIGLFRFHRQSEPGGWIYSLRQQLRGPNRLGAILSSVLFLLVVTLPFYPNFHAHFANFPLESWLRLAFCALLALYFGIRVPKSLPGALADRPSVESAPAASRSIVAGR